jgi:hypothetical protein
VVGIGVRDLLMHAPDLDRRTLNLFTGKGGEAGNARVTDKSKGSGSLARTS